MKYLFSVMFLLCLNAEILAQIHEVRIGVNGIT